MPAAELNVQRTDVLYGRRHSRKRELARTSILATSDLRQLGIAHIMAHITMALGFTFAVRRSTQKRLARQGG